LSRARPIWSAVSALSGWAVQEGLRQRGFLIAAGALAKRPSFRVGSIGQIDHKVVKAFAAAVEDVLKEMDIQEFTPPDI
jgi:aspartate aminotransferase-like enzyme